MSYVQLTHLSPLLIQSQSVFVVSHVISHPKHDCPNWKQLSSMRGSHIAVYIFVVRCINRFQLWLTRNWSVSVLRNPHNIATLFPIATFPLIMVWSSNETDIIRSLGVDWKHQLYTSAPYQIVKSRQHNFNLLRTVSSSLLSSSTIFLARLYCWRKRVIYCSGASSDVMMSICLFSPYNSNEWALSFSTFRTSHTSTVTMSTIRPISSLA